MRGEGPWAQAAAALLRVAEPLGPARRRRLLDLSAALLEAPPLRLRGISPRRILEGLVFRHLREHFHEVPVHVVPCIQGEPTAGHEAGFWGSIFPAVWSFQLALRSRGLGSALTTLHLFQEKAAAELLGIPEGMSQVALLPVAYTKGTDFKHAQRPAPETITSWNGWGPE